MKTTMSNPSLPPEILDYIVDNLRDEPYALRNCRLVAKSWIPRARKHFFANIKFFSPERLESWKKTFPDPSNSPAYHARTLSVKCPHVVTAEDGGEDGWVRTFSRVVRLDVDSSVLCPNDSETFLAPFHGFSPVLKSLRVASTVLPLSRILGLVRSLPLLEDLTLIIYGIPGNDGFSARGPPIPIPPSNSPPLTGTLGLDLPGGAEITVSRLLSLPNGLHFRRITLVWFRKDDIRWINDLIAGCSNTLETLDIKRRLFGAIVRLFASRPIPYFRLQTIGWCPRLTSQKQQDSKTYGFGADSRAPNGSSWCFKPSHPSIEISGKYHFTFPTGSPSTVPVPTSDEPLERLRTGSG